MLRNTEIYLQSGVLGDAQPTDVTEIADVIAKDIALVRLNVSGLPLCQEIAQFASGLPSDDDSSLTLVGYGSTSRDVTIAHRYGVLHKMTIPYDSTAVIEGGPWCGSAVSYNSSSYSPVYGRRLFAGCEDLQVYEGSTEYVMSIGMGVRSGDSGGPMFDEQRSIVGIASHLKEDVTSHLLITGVLLDWVQTLIPPPPSPPSSPRPPNPPSPNPPPPSPPPSPPAPPSYPDSATSHLIPSHCQVPGSCDDDLASKAICSATVDLLLSTSTTFKGGILGYYTPYFRDDCCMYERPYSPIESQYGCPTCQGRTFCIEESWFTIHECNNKPIADATFFDCNLAFHGYRAIIKLPIPTHASYPSPPPVPSPLPSPSLSRPSAPLPPLRPPPLSPASFPSGFPPLPSLPQPPPSPSPSFPPGIPHHLPQTPPPPPSSPSSPRLPPPPPGQAICIQGYWPLYDNEADAAVESPAGTTHTRVR